LTAGSGCSPCVFDTYYEQLEQHQLVDVKRWQEMVNQQLCHIGLCVWARLGDLLKFDLSVGALGDEFRQLERQLRDKERAYAALETPALAEMVQCALEQQLAVAQGIGEAVSSGRSATELEPEIQSNRTPCQAGAIPEGSGNRLWLTLSRVRRVTYNSSIFTFRLPPELDAGARWDFQPCSHLVLQTERGRRAYTPLHPMELPSLPITSSAPPGSVDVLVKLYPGGLLSSHIHEMKIGEGIIGTARKGSFQWEPGEWDHILMLCGGTGVVPMLQVINASLRSPSQGEEVEAATDRGRPIGKLTLVVADRTEADILLNAELTKAVEDAKGRLSLHRVLSKPSFRWRGLRGRIDSKQIERWMRQLNAGSQEQQATRTVVLVSGPPSFDRDVAATSRGLAGAGDCVVVL